MIDLKTLAREEAEYLKEAGDVSGIVHKARLELAEIRRLAMRYLALREQYVDYGLTEDRIYGTDKWGTAEQIGSEYDAAADQLIQEMMK